jgi:hypothetical protein
MYRTSGRDERGGRVHAGLCFCRLRQGNRAAKLVRRPGIEPRTYRLRDNNRRRLEAIVAQRILKTAK